TTSGGAGSTGVGGAGGNLYINSSGGFTQIGNVINNSLIPGFISVNGGNGTVGGVGGGVSILTKNGFIAIGGPINAVAGTSSNGSTTTNNGITLIAGGAITELQATIATINAGNPNGRGGAINIIAGTSNTTVCNPCTASSTGGEISFG